MTSPDAHPQRLRVAHLNPRGTTAFRLIPNADTCAAIAEELGLERLASLEFKGSITAADGDSWQLDGKLTATVVQACVVSFKPVKTRLGESVQRRYSPHIRPPEEEEIEMPDETLEPLGQFIDLTGVMIEELTLALPEYPRAPNAEIPEDLDPAEADETRRPFADLDKLLKGRGNQG